MRLHHLSVSSFGPFADTQHVDFDELNDAGLFLLTGATGAGKSSLLDAVCFALYGVVPGVRGTKTLKSQHAPADVAPEVVLDVTLQGRRFVVRRSPEWTRPKKRGDGLMTEKASASILETTDGTERLLSARAAEVGVLVRSLMGMSATQFQQVALLPQGEFQTFLRATSQERHDVLEQLFRTDRFSRIEDWVLDRSRELSQRSRIDETTVRRLVDTIADRAQVQTPDALLGDSLARAAADDRVLPWVAGLLADSEQAVSVAAEDHEGAMAALTTSRTRYDEARARDEQRRRREQAHRTLAALADGAPAAAEAAEALDAHERAARCATALELLRDARAGRDQAAADLQATLLTAPSEPDAAEVLQEATLAAMLDSARRRATLLRLLLPRETAAAAARESQRSDEQRLLAAEQRLQAAEQRAAQLPAETDSVRLALAEATAVAARGEGLAEAVTNARRVRDAAGELVVVREQVRQAQEARRQARDLVQDARDVVQDLTARRLAGMAAELAGALEHGAPCPVCGGTEHPEPTHASPEAVTAADQEAADRLLADRTAELETTETALRGLETRREVLAATAGDLTADAAAAAVAGLEADLRASRAADAKLTPLQQRLDVLLGEHDALTERRTSAATEAATLRQAVAAHALAAQNAEEEIAAALGDEAATTISEALVSATATTERLVAALDGVRALDTAERRLSDAAQRADESAARHGFATVHDVATAVLADHERDGLITLLRERAEAEARALAALEETDVHSVDATDLEVGDPADELERRRHQLVDAEAHATGCARSLAIHEERLAALRSQVDRLGQALETWTPVRNEALRAESMARLVRGMGHDNQLQMRLSAYVLATRLDQVVDAANERLGQMRDQRYLLQRTGRAHRRTGQAGLGLEVVDQWTGDVRAPTTLSGGETFVVSLALALGLADVVTHEAAGAEVETLFVDEGFGTLDADTLDDVMDRLDGLRAGGRTVGVVSHVTELRTRIPTQVQVEKGRAGSSVTVHTLVG